MQLCFQLEKILHHEFDSIVNIQLTLWPINLVGGDFLVKFHRNMMLSMPAEATYLHEGYKSSAITDYLCPLSVRIKLGYCYVVFIIKNSVQSLKIILFLIWM